MEQEKRAQLIATCSTAPPAAWSKNVCSNARFSAPLQPQGLQPVLRRSATTPYIREKECVIMSTRIPLRVRLCHNALMDINCTDLITLIGGLSWAVIMLVKLHLSLRAAQ